MHAVHRDHYYICIAEGKCLNQATGSSGPRAWDIKKREDNYILIIIDTHLPAIFAIVATMV